MSRKSLLRIFASLCFIYGLYIILAVQKPLLDAFDHPVSRAPSRIYSEPFLLQAGLPQALVENELKVRHIVAGTTFSLPAISYPTTLLPERYPTELFSKPRAITLRFEHKKLASMMLDHDTYLSELYLEPELISTFGSDYIQQPVSFDRFPPALWQAVLAIEDQHFLDHVGFEPKSIARALLTNLKQLRLAQGGSTITQQLVKNLIKRRGRHVGQKIHELILALILEYKYDKQVILERYLNEIYLGQIGGAPVHGAAEGAQLYFHKNIEELSLAECALLAGFIRGPTLYGNNKKQARERQLQVLRMMVTSQFIAQNEADLAAQDPLLFAPASIAASQSPFITDSIKELVPDAPRTIYSTINMAEQRAAEKAMEKHLGKFHTPLDATLISCEHKTGAIRVLIGGRNYSKSSFNRALSLKRPAGSTWKPFIALAACELLPLSGATMVLDAPIDFPNWHPQNIDHAYQGQITLRHALHVSRNTPFIRISELIGRDKVQTLARSLGIHTEIPDVPSAALGTSDVTPLDLLTAYATIANNGIRPKLTLIHTISDTPVLSAGCTDLIRSMLALDPSSFGKTGTSGQGDAWFVGSTQLRTGLVWVGRAPHVSGKTHAYPLWRSTHPSTQDLDYPHLIDCTVDSRLDKCIHGREPALGDISHASVPNDHTRASP